MSNEMTNILEIDALLADHEQLLPEVSEPEPIGEGILHV
jgi:hypothetical protein